MPLDPSIALSGRPPQIDDPNTAFAKYMQMQHLQQQNALGKYQMAKAMRDDEAANALSAAYRQPGVVGPEGVNSNALMQHLSRGSAAGQIPTVQKSMLESEEKRAKISKEQVETAIKNMELHRNQLVTVNDPMAYQAWRANVVASNPKVDATIPREFSPQVRANLLQTADQMVERLYAKLTEVDQGGVIQGRNPYTNEPVGAPIQKTETPDSIANRGVTMRGQNMQDARSRELAAVTREGASKPPSGYRWAGGIQGGELEPIPGGPAGKDKALTEAQSKATLYLGMMRDAEKAITASGFKPDSLASQVDLQMARGDLPMTPKVMQNIGASKEAQVYAQGAFQWSEAMLRQLTGAAAPDQEVWRNAKTYFPMPGDDAKVIKRKNEARAQLQRHVETLAASGAEQVKAKEGPDMKARKDGFGPIQRVD